MDCAARMRKDGHKNMRLILRSDGAEEDSRRYNLPGEPEVACVIADSTAGKSRDIAIAMKGGGFFSIHESHPYYDPLAYALIHPRGEHGWRFPIPHTRGGRKVTPQQFASYRIMVRRDATNALRRFGRLFHQYLCDQWSKVEQQRLRFIRSNQDQLRAASYRQIKLPPQDAVRGVDLGKRVILPSTFTGCSRQMSELYQDAMAIVRSFGKPHLFITFTCNPSWQEVADALFPNQTAAMRPDITARVFRLKLNAPREDIFDVGVLGEVIARMYVIEFQKRGLPHAHII